jgi:hypothetical protein
MFSNNNLCGQATLGVIEKVKILGCASLTLIALASAHPAQAQSKNNDAGIELQFGNSTSIGIRGRIGVSNNFSIRPEIFFGYTPGVESRQFTTPVSLTTQNAYTAARPYSLPAVSAGSTSLGNGILQVPLTLSAPYTLPVSFTPNVPIVIGNNTFAAGTAIAAGTVVPAGTVLPAGLSVANVGLPAGTVLQAGTTVPANTVIPSGTVVPSGSLSSRATGTSFGVAATYDFNLDRQGKSTAYIGPKVAFASASGPATYYGQDIPGSNVNISETKIGMVIGADYAVSDDFVVGANLTYNISRSTSGSGTLGNNSGNISDFIQSNGSSLDLGVRVGFRF